MIKVEVFGKGDCHLCEKALHIIRDIQKEIPFELSVIDISEDEDLFREFREEIPVVFMNGVKAFRFFVDKDEFIKKIFMLEEKT